MLKLWQHWEIRLSIQRVRLVMSFFVFCVYLCLLLKINNLEQDEGFWWKSHQMWCTMAKVWSPRWVSLSSSLHVPISVQSSSLRWYFGKKHSNILFETSLRLTSYVPDAFWFVQFSLHFSVWNKFLPDMCLWCLLVCPLPSSLRFLPDLSSSSEDSIWRKSFLKSKDVKSLGNF